MNVTPEQVIAALAARQVSNQSLRCGYQSFRSLEALGLSAS